MRRRSAFGWLELAIGILLIGLGIWTFAEPDRALTGMAAVFGLAAVCMGIADIILFIRLERFIGFGPILSLIACILSVMSGIMLLAYPKAGALALALLFPIWFIAHCISRLSHLPRVRLVAGSGTYYLLLAINVVGLILGVMMLFSPFFTMSAIRCFAGGYLVLLGIDSVIVAISRMGMYR